MESFCEKTCVGFWCKNMCKAFGGKTCTGFFVQKLCFGEKKKLRKVFVDKSVQYLKSVQGFGKKGICRDLVQNHVQGFSVKTRSGFWYKNIYRVLV